VQVSVEDQRLVRVSVLADVAQTYTELRGAQARLRVAREISPPSSNCWTDAAAAAPRV